MVAQATRLWCWEGESWREAPTGNQSTEDPMENRETRLALAPRTGDRSKELLRRNSDREPMWRPKRRNGTESAYTKQDTANPKAAKTGEQRLSACRNDANTDTATTTTQPLSLRRTRLRRTNSAGQLDRTREREPTTRHRASETTNPKPDHSTEQEHQIWKEESWNPGHAPSLPTKARSRKGKTRPNLAETLNADLLCFPYSQPRLITRRNRVHGDPSLWPQIQNLGSTSSSRGSTSRLGGEEKQERGNKTRKRKGMTRRRWCTANHAPERRGAHKFAEIRERRREREKVFWLPSSALKNKKKLHKWW